MNSPLARYLVRIAYSFFGAFSASLLTSLPTGWQDAEVALLAGIGAGLVYAVGGYLTPLEPAVGKQSVT